VRTIEEVRELQQLSDPAARGRRITELLNHYQSVIAELQRSRREVIQELKAQGLNNTEIGPILGVSRARVSQLQDSGPPPERALLGMRRLTVAVAQKQESEFGRPAVAQETVEAVTRLHKLAGQLGLEADWEYVQKPGIIDLNRDDLVIMVGPRFSPIVSQILESDPCLKFRKDEEWHIVDQADNNEVYRSELDRGLDYGYIGRLPRPDGRGTFLYAAGIHATGLSGAITYLEQELAGLYQATRGKRFSLLIRSTFDLETHEVLTAEAATPIYKPEEHGATR
jgi:hypothetical protein